MLDKLAQFQQDLREALVISGLCLVVVIPFVVVMVRWLEKKGLR